MTAIVDTSFLVALSDRTELSHPRIMRLIDEVEENLILPTPVLPEAFYLISSRLGHYYGRRLVKDLLDSTMQLESPSRDDLRRAHQILEKYADSRLDFVDASIVALAERLNVTRIFTLDRRDFGIIRPKHCPSFEILP